MWMDGLCLRPAEIHQLDLDFQKLVMKNVSLIEEIHDALVI